MAAVVLRVRLTSRDHIDVTYAESDSVNENEVIEHALSTLADHAGVLRCRHCDRLVVPYAL